MKCGAMNSVMRKFSFVKVGLLLLTALLIFYAFLAPPSSVNYVKKIFNPNYFLEPNRIRSETAITRTELTAGGTKSTRKESHRAEIESDVTEIESVTSETDLNITNHSDLLSSDLFTSNETFNKNWANLSIEEISKLSVLGRRLFLYEDVGSEQSRNFTIHVWKHMPQIKKRFMYRYTKTFYDPFEFCSVRNCHFTSKDEDVTKADAVLFHLQKTNSPPTEVPRTPDQIWVWLSDESPKAIFNNYHQNLTHYNGLFNWSMTYRMDSDVPVPYGRTIPLTQGEKMNLSGKGVEEGKTKDITLLGSHCSGANKRYVYLNKLKKLINIDIYGKCGIQNACPGHFRKNCDVINDYKIYLAFENNNCDDYLTEKVWWNALSKGLVPIVMGTKKENYKKILPPNSFIHVDDFESVYLLAEYLKFVVETPSELAKYHEWRKDFKIVNEHGYFGSPAYHFCRLCEALNYNDKPVHKTADLVPFFDPKLHCYEAKEAT